MYKILKHNKYILIKTTKYGLRRIEIRWESGWRR